MGCDAEKGKIGDSVTSLGKMLNGLGLKHNSNGRWWC